MTDEDDTPEVFDDLSTDDVRPALHVIDGQQLNGGDLPMRMTMLAGAGTPATEAAIRSRILSAYPGRHWDQLCQAFARDVCALFGHGGVGYPSARAAIAASKIASTTASKAPAASFHYWRIGTYDHVMVGVGGARIVGATKYVDTYWGAKVQAIGATTVQRYTARTGARYIGWSLTNGANDFPWATASLDKAAAKRRDDVRKLAKHLNGLKLGKTTTAASDGDPGAAYWWLVQTAGHKDGSYPKTSPADGEVGSLTRKSEARQLARL